MNDNHREPSSEPDESEQVRVTPGLVVWGIVALLIGLAGGVVFSLMSVIR